ncbi:unnamed protein product [Allacma fusca]|uniref:Uncharacterized protein n=1 Tax=Allacma fusca TaxID=39272 RepID=A0A8J2JBS1_9HEXA|nr:unnamed protein product [Allacma fusca]
MSSLALQHQVSDNQMKSYSAKGDKPVAFQNIALLKQSGENFDESARCLTLKKKYLLDRLCKIQKQILNSSPPEQQRILQLKKGHRDAEVLAVQRWATNWIFG